MSDYKPRTVIWLQPSEWPEVTWCEHKQYDDDIKYIIADESKAFNAGRESVIANRETFQKVKAEGIREGYEQARKEFENDSQNSK